MSEIKKSQWGKGLWQDEPDELQWVDEATGLTCLILRNPVGAFCGYVGVPETHPGYKIAYDGTTDEEHKEWQKAYRKHLRRRNPNINPLNDFENFPKHPDTMPGIGEVISNISIHGGLTYAGFWPDKVPDLWFFGFDCAHAGDLCPGLMATLKRIHIDERITLREEFLLGDTYRTIDYVKAECASLAAQLKAIGNAAIGALAKLKTAP